MATSKSELQSFQNSWNQTAAWAQSKGIKYNDYYPIYQQDTQRLLEGYPMSQAERERAVSAAANIQQPTQATPSTASNPTNVIGNTITDLRNLFTGIGDIAIHPLHNGLVDSVYNTVDLLTGAHHLTGVDAAAKLGDALTSTVLSWIPGMSDIGTVLQADPHLSGDQGLIALADHPVNSILDVVPLLKPFGAVSDAGRLADISERTGIPINKVDRAGLLKVGKGILMNTKTQKMGPEGLMTIGDRFHAMTAGSILNASPAIADVSQGAEITLNEGGTTMRWLFKDVEETRANLTDEQKKAADDILYGGYETNLEERLKANGDPAVEAAVRAELEGPKSFITEEAIAAKKGPVLKRNPFTGKVDMFTRKGHKAVIKAADDLDRQTQRIIETQPVFEALASQTQKTHRIFQAVLDALDKANQKARNVHVDSSDTFPTKLAGAKHPIGSSKAAVAEQMFGTGGKIDLLLNKMREGRFLETEAIADAWLKRMDHWDRLSVDAGEESPVEWQAVRAQVQNAHDVAAEMNRLRAEADKAVYGQGEVWTGQTPYRDYMHEMAAKAQKDKHAEETRMVKDLRQQQFARLRQAYRMKNAEIKARYAKAKRTNEAYLTDKETEIKERYGLAKAKADNDMRLARESHQEWLRGRRAQGLPASRDYIEAAQEGSHIAPGARGSIEALRAVEQALDLKMAKELEDLRASVKSDEQLLLERDRELTASHNLEAQMNKRLNTAYDKKLSDTEKRQAKEKKQLRKENYGKKGREGKVSKLYNDFTKAQKAFAEAVWKKPSDNNTDLYFNLLSKHLVKNEEARDTLTEGLRKKYGWNDEQINDLRANPKVMGQLVNMAIDGTFKDPIFEEIDPQILQDAKDSARDELVKLNKQGIYPEYIPHVSEASLRADGTGSYGIRLVVGHGIPDPDALSPRNWDMAHSKFDVMAGLTRGVKQILDRDAIHTFISDYLDKHISTEAELTHRMMEYFPDQMNALSKEGKDAVAGFMAGRLKDWNLVEFDPENSFGTSLPRWGRDKVYIDADLLKATEKLTDKGKELPTRGVFDKATRLFRFSILGLSPRYTAHITLGGTFLLALRSSPYVVTVIGDAWKAMKTGDLDDRYFPTPTNMGTTDFEISSKATLDEFHYRAGQQSVRMMAQEWIEKNIGIKYETASPVHWLKALGDLNLHFTSQVVHMQRSIALLDGAAKVERYAKHHTFLDEHGNAIEMTKERAMQEGMKHAEAVFGDLRRMSPFERQVARTWVPFYGWEKHILKYVLSFPADHPWRAMMLAQMAELDSQMSPGGLPSRYQFLFFLGQPDAQGNVTALDLRAVNPLRDVANYATLGGIISSMNPVVTSGVSMIDPQIIYGGTTLYPNVTYDQFYGIEEAGAQGNLVTAASQIVPQIGGIQSAMQLAGARQGMNTSDLVKSIGNQLNFPWVPQHINLKQEAAKTALAQYQVTKTLAANAWDSGDFSAIQDLGSVPDPRNPDYETPVSDLQALYNQLAAEYPGVPPSDTAQSLPSVHL